MKKNYKNIILAAVLISAFAFTSYSAEFSIAGYWAAKGSPRQIETFTTGWEFSLDNFKSKKNVSIPHSIDEGEIGFEASGGANRQQPAWYRRNFIWKKKGERQFLHFEAIMGKSKISLNGKLLTEHFGGYLPIHLEVTGILKEGKNTLEVWCDNSNDPTYPPGKSQNVLDFTYFGGLYRDVYLIETGDAYVTDTDKGGVWITSNLNDDGTWKIKTDVTLGGNTENTEVQLFYDGKKVDSTFSLKSPSLWSPENPNLHFLRVDVLKKGKLTDRVNVRFGIRDFKMTKEGFILNGKNYEKKLIGTNRHQDYVFIGNALPNSLHWRDVKKFKDCGMNIFRCAHYPQDPAFMDACDELGMFVIDATPGWQFWNKKHPRFEACVYSDIERMVRRDRSRPSLLFWEPILNETHFPAYFTTNAVTIVKQNAHSPNNMCACDKQSAGSDVCDIKYSHQALKDDICYRREWGDWVDNWSAQNSPSRILREWGETAMIRQAQHYQHFIKELDSQTPNHFGGCLWHGADHARGYHPDNFYGGILTYARQKKYSWYAFKAALTKKPFIFLAHELSCYSPSEFVVFSNCTYKATLLGNEFNPETSTFDYKLQHRVAGGERKKRINRNKTSNCFRATLSNGEQFVSYPAGRLNKIILDLDTEGLAPIADGGDLVAVNAILSDKNGTPKRYDTEKILFSVEGEADIVGENPQITRWGEAVVLIRPRASKNPKPITIKAKTIRNGQYTPKAGKITFTPGKAKIEKYSFDNDPNQNDKNLRQVEEQQHEFEIKG